MGHTPLLTIRNGIGTALLFFRRIEPDKYEATVWFTFLFLPLVPQSTWVIRPRGVHRSRSGNTFSTFYDVEFIERRPTKPLRVMGMYVRIMFHLAVMFGPPVLTVLACVFIPGLLDPGGVLAAALIPGIVVYSALWLPGYAFFLLWQKDKHFRGARMF